jgi:hypothetical protein
MIKIILKIILTFYNVNYTPRTFSSPLFSRLRLFDGNQSHIIFIRRFIPTGIYSYLLVQVVIAILLSMLANSHSHIQRSSSNMNRTVKKLIKRDQLG